MRSFRLSSPAAWLALAVIALFASLLLGGQARADVVYTQSCQNGQCSIQALPLAILTPLAPTPVAQSAPCYGSSCGTQSVTVRQTTKYTSSRRGLFSRLFSRGSARSSR